MRHDERLSFETAHSVVAVVREKSRYLPGAICERSIAILLLICTDHGLQSPSSLAVALPQYILRPFGDLAVQQPVVTQLIQPQRVVLTYVVYVVPSAARVRQR